MATHRLQLDDTGVYLDGVQVYPSQLTLHMDARTQGKGNLGTVHLVLPVEVEANLSAMDTRLIPTERTDNATAYAARTGRHLDMGGH